MRQNPNTRRSRGRGGRKPGGSRNQIFDSNGPGARVRGNSSQIYEKYQQLARDASSSGDRVAAENYYQHAEHYFRMMEVAGLNRNGNAQDEPQQQSDQAAQNGEAVAVAEAASPSVAESAPVVIEATEAQNPGPQDQAPTDATNGGGAGENDAKPARRAGGRRSNGSANDQDAPDKDADAAAEDDAETQKEDTKPVSA